MTSIEQSIVYEDVWYIKINDTVITTDIDSVKKIVRSFMSTDVGQEMLKDFINRNK